MYTTKLLNIGTVFEVTVYGDYVVDIVHNDTIQTISNVLIV